jgi:hypothetical protein
MLEAGKIHLAGFRVRFASDRAPAVSVDTLPVGVY